MGRLFVCASSNSRLANAYTHKLHLLAFQVAVLIVFMEIVPFTIQRGSERLKSKVFAFWMLLTE